MIFALFLAFGTLALAHEAYKHYRRDLASRAWPVVLAEVVETVPATTLERDGMHFGLRHGSDYVLRWYVDGSTHIHPLDASMSIDLGGWVLWQRPLSRKPWRVRHDTVDPMRHEIEADVRMWRWYAIASGVFAIAAIVAFSML